ncbi:MAG: serine/threonine protein kinase, partial [Myxococcales bacterium]|nr:serine/threonine protein kinase [Myxococcales bacterium]
MGTVWAAEHLTLGVQVAIKVVDLRGDDDADVAAARFLREARVSARVKHRYVIEILDFGRLDDGAPYMVMERLDGESLGDRIRRQGTLPLEEALGLMAQVLTGLRAVHEQGVVHRDLTPENVFLVRDSEGAYPKLLDFGISRVLERSERGPVTTVAGRLIGTPEYMAPEQARGSGDLDHRVDLYAVGVLLYEALTGALPFEAEGFGELLGHVMFEEPIPIERRRPDLPPAVCAVVRKALTKRREERYQSAREMREALLAAAEALGMSPAQAAREPARTRSAPPPSACVEGTAVGAPSFPPPVPRAAAGAPA